eukprot:SAG11_NODE_719_length_7564_cov_14.939317_5_plen_121_part_00
MLLRSVMARRSVLPSIRVRCVPFRPLATRSATETPDDTVPSPHVHFICQAPAMLGGALNDYSCGGFSAMGKWLAKEEVAKALHIVPFRYPGAVAYGPRMAGDVRPLYKKYAQKIKVMICT